MMMITPILLFPMKSTSGMMSPLKLTPKQEIAQKIAFIAYHMGVDEKLAIQIAKCESGLNQNAVSSTKDYGVMQINKKANGKLAEKLGFNIHNTDDNIRFGLWLILKDGAKRHYSASFKCWNPKISNLTGLPSG